MSDARRENTTNFCRGDAKKKILPSNISDYAILFVLLHLYYTSRLMEIRWIHTLALLLIIAIPTSSRSAMEPDETLPQSEYDAQLRAIDLPLIEIWTTDGTEPTATVVQAPEGMWGTALQGNEYV